MFIYMYLGSRPRKVSLPLLSTSLSIYTLSNQQQYIHVDVHELGQRHRISETQSASATVHGPASRAMCSGAQRLKA